MEKYKLTPDHEKELKPWSSRWIANAMSTKPMDEDEKEICRNAVIGMYEAAGKKPPPRERIVFVSSPFILKFAAGFASAIWYLRKNIKMTAIAATRAATDTATSAATRAATDNATDNATDAATYAATSAATRAATDNATDAATYAAT